MRKRAQTLKIENGDVFVEGSDLKDRADGNCEFVSLRLTKTERELLDDSTAWKEWWQMYKKL